MLLGLTKEDSLSLPILVAMLLLATRFLSRSFLYDQGVAWGGRGWKLEEAGAQHSWWAR